MKKPIPRAVELNRRHLINCSIAGVIVEFGNDAIEKALELLRSLKTLEGIKEHEQEIMDFIENAIVFGTDQFRKILTMSLKPEQIKNEFDKFQKTQEQFNKEVQREMDRIGKIEGAKEYIESLREEMETRLKPHTTELANLMGKIMGVIIQQFMNGIGKTMSRSSKERAGENENKENEETVETDSSDEIDAENDSENEDEDN